MKTTRKRKSGRKDGLAWPTASCQSISDLIRILWLFNIVGEDCRITEGHVLNFDMDYAVKHEP
jgi:hypothetical protein